MFHFVSFRFVSKQSKTLNSGDVFLDIFVTKKGASTPASKKMDVSCSNNNN